MAERDRTPETWRVPFARGLLIAVAMPLVLLASLVVAGLVYDRTLRPLTAFEVAPLPTPQLETRINIPTVDPRRAPEPRSADARIAAAKKAVVLTGLRGWSDGR